MNHHTVLVGSDIMLLKLAMCPGSGSEVPAGSISHWKILGRDSVNICLNYICSKIQLLGGRSIISLFANQMIMLNEHQSRNQSLCHSGFHLYHQIARISIRCWRKLVMFLACLCSPKMIHVFHDPWHRYSLSNNEDVSSPGSWFTHFIYFMRHNSVQKLKHFSEFI